MDLHKNNLKICGVLEEAQDALAELWSCVGAVTPDLLICLRSFPDGALLGGQSSVFIKKIKARFILVVSKFVFISYWLFYKENNSQKLLSYITSACSELENQAGARGTLVEFPLQGKDWWLGQALESVACHGFC